MATRKTDLPVYLYGKEIGRVELGGKNSATCEVNPEALALNGKNLVGFMLVPVRQ